MSRTVSISFQDDRGEWREAITVPAEDLTEATDQRGWTDFLINLEPRHVVTMAPYVDMSGTRMWRIVWSSDHGESPRSAEGRMKIMQLGAQQFNLRSEG
jgi:hypothetical protein